MESLFGQPSTPLRARHISGYVITCDVRDPVQRSLFYRGTYEPRTSKLVARSLRPGETFLDVGANVGHYTFLAAHIVRPRGTVLAVEASPSTAANLRADVERNGLQSVVTVHSIAAGDAAGRMALRGRDNAFDVGARHLDWVFDSEGSEVVDVAALDEVLGDAKPSVVKIDTEGADLRALKGLRRIIQAAKPRLILAEADDAQLARFGDSIEALNRYMESLGYVGRPIRNAWEPDGLAFVPIDALPRPLACPREGVDEV